ncbi:MAG: hypothetical protein CL424_08475 [Acidimicrobiaceae bacterium]|nr:hypothetical protein [Acidimicrobiaceae bacterium]
MTVEPELLSTIPYLVVRDDVVVEHGPDLERELGIDPAPLLGPLASIGQRLDDGSFADVLSGIATIRVRLGAQLAHRPVRLRHLATDGDRTWLEVRSLADEFRLEKLLRRSGFGHMLLSPSVELLWSITSNDLADVFPGDDPMNWVELMDPDDMEALGRAIAEVGADPNLQRSVSHRLNADRTYTITDTVESAVHDPDLRGVLVRSRLEEAPDAVDPDAASAFAGVTVSDHMPIGVIVASDQGRVLHRNAAAGSYVGARTGQLVVPHGGEAGLFDGLGAEHIARFASVFAAATAGIAGHCTLVSPTDHRRWLRLSVSPAAASTVVITIEDHTELAETERALRASNRLLEALDAHSEDLVLVFDAVGSSRYVSSAVARHLGDDVEIEQLDDLLPFVHPTDRNTVAELWTRIRTQPSKSAATEFRLTDGDESNGRWHHIRITNLIDDPDVGGVVVTMRDVHERHLVERDLRFRATHDALTTLPDRSALQSRLEVLLRKGEHDGWRTAIVFCDVDRFKLINDSAGHRVGDRVLTEVADRLRTALRSSDFVGRFGGDEFVVVAPNVDDDEHAMALAQRIFDAVVGRVHVDGFDIDVSLSMGVAVSDDECATAAGLLHRSDIAMYESKRTGRSRITLYRPDLDLAGDGSGALRSDLRDAIAQGQLAIYYQPIVALDPALEPGYESLARWEHPEFGVVGAGRFMAVADSAGMGTVLGDELVRLACRNARGALAGGAAFVSINLSSAQLSHRDAAASLLDQMRLHGVDPGSVVIELTEAAFAQGPTVQANLETFRATGVRIFLDDFGVGYSSLSQLHHFPVDGIKIDTSIVNPEVDVDLVRLIVGVARTLGIRTVAEGVERDDQLEIVRREGVDYAQGFLLGRPEPTPASIADGNR